MQVQPYLYFEGRTEEAIAFYQKTLGAQVEMMMRMNEAPPEAQTPGQGCRGDIDTSDKILHASFRIGDTSVMASDGMCSGKADFQGFSLTLTVADDAEAAQKFALLADGGEVQMPVDKTFFASSFGMVKDRFGVLWIVIAPLPM
ncbi:MAG: VOC family protein [Spongiibacteraceae bacterium]